MNLRDRTLRTIGTSVVALALAIGGCALASDGARATTSLEPEQDEDGAPLAESFPSVPESAGPVSERTVASEWGPLSFTYRMIDGAPIAEGDIVLPDDRQEVQSATSIGRRWPGAVVPYVIDVNLPLSDRVTAAIAHWEANTKLRFVPRTTERDYVHFRSGSGCSSMIGQQGGRQFVNLTTSEFASSVVAIGIDRSTTPERVYFFYKRGFATAGSITRVNALASHFRFILAPGKATANLVDVAFASNGHLFAWYDDGSVSEGTHEDLALYAPAQPYALAVGKTPADVAGFAIGADDRAHAFYTDGTFSVGTAFDLAASEPPQPFTVADGKTVADLAHVDVSADGAFHAFYVDTVPHPDGGAPSVRGLSSSSGTASSLAATTGLARTSFPGHCGTGATMHEIGHAVGLFHEQTRHDRDQFVKILWENVEPDERYNFDKHSRVVGSDTGTYDFGSIMHYGPKAFSANGQPTIVAADGHAFTEQRDGLSPGDLAGVAAMYP